MGLKLVVIVPCLNEGESILQVLRAIPQRIPKVSAVVPLVVDDGSTDETARIAAKAGALVRRHNTNRGVGAAFQTGLEAALEQGADLIVNIDGDGQFDPADIPKLIAPLLENRADFVTASRFADPALVPHMPGIKRWGNQRIAWLISTLIGQRVYDVSCGFRAYLRETAMHLNLVGQFTYTQETFLDLAFKGFRILEVPVRVRGQREFGESRVARSILRYAINSSKIIFKSYRDYQPLLFFGTIAAWLMLGAGVLFTVFLWHYFTTGRFTGQLWAGFSGAGLAFSSLVIFLIGTVADMLDRIRMNQERLLYYERRRVLGSANAAEEKRQEGGVSQQ